MSLLSTKSQNYLANSLKKISLPLTIAVAFSGTNANALPFSNLNESNNSFLKSLQVISQYEPPEVIIDDNPRDSNRTSQRNADAVFSCDQDNGEYTVMYHPESRPNQAYPWATPSNMGGGWTAQERCLEIARRLEAYRADGLIEMSTGVENGYNTICVTTQVDPTDCRIVLTVPPGQDPQLTRDLVFDNLLIADDGQQTQGVYTYTENGGDLLNQIGNVIEGVSGNNSRSKSPESIDLRPFLDRADGGTGEQLGKQMKPSRNQSRPARENTGERKPAIFQ
ncbi:MAG: COP23 domain-containing protein [Xenococcaceae cyanobacterium MO_188.B32]|nr:COP23 domain-containing protein [Xenococcaceae cyanobacterium MO_188.B32]